MRPDLLDLLEIRLTRGLQADARQSDHHESVARVLLAAVPEGGLSMGDMATQLGRDPTTATRFVDRAVVQGLVRRQAGKQDRRRRLVVLTPEGVLARDDLLRRRRHRAETLLDAMLASTGLGRGQVEWFLAALAAGLDPV